MSNVIGHILIDEMVTPSNASFKIITESSEVSSMKGTMDKNGNPHRIIAEGVVQTASEINRNGLFYRKDVLFPALQAERVRTQIKTGDLKAEDGHPVTDDIKIISNINSSNCCARFLDIWTDGDDVWARFKGTFNDRGNEFDADLRDGWKPNWSLRALGSMEEFKEGGKVYVGAGKNLIVVTYDKVGFPSHPNATTRRILQESVSRPNKDGINIMTESVLIKPVYIDQIKDYVKDKSMNVKKFNESFGLFFETTKVISENAIQINDFNGNSYIINLESYISKNIKELFI